MSKRAALTATAMKWVSLWNAPVDWELFDGIHADDFQDCASAGRAPTKQGFAQGLREFTRVFPDVRVIVEDLVVDEEKSTVAVRWSARGTNAERYLGIGPTNRTTVITGIEIIEMMGSQVVRRWGEWDISDHSEGRAS